MECYMAMTRSKGGGSDVKGIVRELFNAAGVRLISAYALDSIILIVTHKNTILKNL